LRIPNIEKTIIGDDNEFTYFRTFLYTFGLDPWVEYVKTIAVNFIKLIPVLFTFAFTRSIKLSLMVFIFYFLWTTAWTNFLFPMFFIILFIFFQRTCEGFLKYWFFSLNDVEKGLLKQLVFFCDKYNEDDVIKKIGNIILKHDERYRKSWLKVVGAFRDLRRKKKTDLKIPDLDIDYIGRNILMTISDTEKSPKEKSPKEIARQYGNKILTEEEADFLQQLTYLCSKYDEHDVINQIGRIMYKNERFEFQIQSWRKILRFYFAKKDPGGKKSVKEICPTIEILRNGNSIFIGTINDDTKALAYNQEVKNNPSMMALEYSQPRSNDDLKLNDDETNLLKDFMYLCSQYKNSIIFERCRKLITRHLSEDTWNRIFNKYMKIMKNVTNDNLPDPPSQIFAIKGYHIIIILPGTPEYVKFKQRTGKNK